MNDRGLILVGMPLPQKFSETVKQLEASQRRYLELSRERKLVRRTYMGLLLLLTVLVLFSTTWLALYLSKLVTRPVVALAEATQEISRGTPGLPRGSQRRRRNRRSGAVFQPHGGRAGNQPPSD